MSQALTIGIANARPEDDVFIDELARLVGLHVHASAERERSQARLKIATRNGERLGFVLAWHVADEIEIVDVAVLTSARKQGVGVALLREILAGPDCGNWASAHLEVRASNRAAQRLYSTLGFRAVGRRVKYYDNSEDALLFRCCLEELL